MAQSARSGPPAPIGIAPRHLRPQAFNGTDVAWRVLCDLYPSAETPEIILAVVEYCAARRLDPLRKPVHVVPIYNSKLRRRVQVVMQGINELETTAHRTGRWAGMGSPKWGPDETKTFKGQRDDDQGNTTNVEVTMTFPSWCEVPVFRLVNGRREQFSEPVFWIEAYGRAGFRSEVPNQRWSIAPRQMLHKCAKAASLRAAFPEEVGYAAEELEDRDVDSGGVTLDGHVDYGDPGFDARDRQQRPPDDPAPQGMALLEDQNKDRWFRGVRNLLAGVETVAELQTIRTHPSVERALAEAPKTMRDVLREDIEHAAERLATPTEENDQGAETTWNDPIAELLAEIEGMDQFRLRQLKTDAQWRVRVKEATTMFPPDEDRIEEAIATRLAALGK